MSTSIKALPASTVQIIASSQVLITPVSLVKELIDNAIDAKATSVDISISTNTIDKIEVRDNGQGIAPQDLHFLGRRGHTSKLRSFEELRAIGGLSLGFRGEALASATELGQVSITTRTEGEAVAASVKLHTGGGIESKSSVSHPVGTTVSVSNLFLRTPVRKQNALKHSTKNLAVIKDLLEDYAFARLHVRFSLKVLKSGKENWVFAARPNDGIKEITSQVVGRDTASQCIEIHNDALGVSKRISGSADVSSNSCLTPSFAIQAFLPKPTAEWSKIGGGPHISFDSRPVSSKQGAPKKILAAYKLYLRNSLPKPVPEKIRDPFIWLNVICPIGSYDPNVEPSKDNLIFDEESALITSVIDVFKDVYGEIGGREHYSQRGLENNLERRRIPLDNGLSQPARVITRLSPISPSSQDGFGTPPGRLNPWMVARMNGRATTGNHHHNVSNSASNRFGATHRPEVGSINVTPQRIVTTSTEPSLPTPRSILPGHEISSLDESQVSLDAWLDSIPAKTNGCMDVALAPRTPPPSTPGGMLSLDDETLNPRAVRHDFTSARQIPLNLHRPDRTVPVVMDDRAASTPVFSGVQDQVFDSSALDIEEALDYERRKEEATKKRRAIFRAAESAASQSAASQRKTQQSSPHKNRYTAAVAVLDTHHNANHTTDGTTSEVPMKTSLSDGDPRAYYMRRRHSAVNKEKPLKRSKTYLLPLESTPDHFKLHALVQAISVNVDIIRRCSEKLTWDYEPLRSDIHTAIDSSVRNRLSDMVSEWCRITGGEGRDTNENVDVQSITGEV